QDGKDRREYAAAIQLRAAALLKLYHAAEADQVSDGMVERVLASLHAVMESKLPAPPRTDALRQWVAIRSRPAGLADCVEMLTQHGNLIGDDAYLLYARTVGTWSQFRARPAPGDAAAAQKEARSIVAACAAAQEAAKASGNTGLTARSALLRSMVLSAPPLRDARETLDVLRENWDLLKRDEDTAGAAAWLRVETLLEMGLTDEALKAVEDLPPAGSGGRAAVLLRLAERVAERHTADDAEGRRRVTELCNQAMAAAAADDIAKRSARAMLAVGANVDARGILTKLLESPQTRNDRAELLDCSLLLGRALTQEGKLDDARKHLESLAKSYPESLAVHMDRGRVDMLLKQPAAAAGHLRKARGLCKPGSPPWCEATLALAEALLADGHRQAAADILRVSAALYPDFGSPELKLRSRELTKELDPGPKGSGDRLR
ncbi:MAG TPA: tetratricopeptide repeat protein, partial [Phycisphaerae bacterium]|nr:tetratricopeptide repeat protein [Phycisphaerae bacterium]